MLSGLAVLDPLAVVLGDGISALRAPVWTPWPLPPDWTLGGVAYTSGVDWNGRDCTATSWLGIDPFGEPAEILLVCEEAGAGVGSYFAGLSTNYPSADVGQGPPHARFTVHGRPVPLWAVDMSRPERAAQDAGPFAVAAAGAPDPVVSADQRSVYVGEAAGRWLWVIVHPAEAGAVVVHPWKLVDARTLGAELASIPIGELSARLVVG